MRRLGLALAAAVFLWAAEGIRAAASERADASATSAKSADTATTGETAKAATPATSAEKADTATTAEAAAPEAAQGDQATGQVTRDEVYPKKFQKVAPSEQKAAALRAAKLGMKPSVAGRTDLTAAAVTPADLLPLEGPGGVPHYFGPFGNFAFSPAPKGTLKRDLIVDSGGSGYTAPTVTITDAYDPTLLANATATVKKGVITATSGPSSSRKDAYTAVRPGTRDRFGSSSTTCFPPAPAGTFSFR